MAKTTERLRWIDALRGIPIIIVIIGHITYVPHSFWLLKWFRGFILPLFFIISGYIFSFDKWNSIGFKTLIIKKTKSYLVPFFVCGLLILFFDVLKDIIFSGTLIEKNQLNYIFNYLNWLLFQIDGNFSGGLIITTWFLPTIFIGTLLLFFILKNNNIIKVLFVVLTMIIVKVTCHYGIKLPWHIDTAFLGTLFMLCGYMTRKYDLLSKLDSIVLQIIILLIGSCCVFFNGWVDFNTRIYTNYHLMFFGALLISFFLLWLFRKLNIKSKPLEVYGYNSILIMFLNIIVFKLFEKLFFYINIGTNYFAYIIAELLFFYVFLNIYNKLENRYRILSVIVGR